jgi:ubiquinone/menaquinone biosynthesis C-methylase UbiE
MGTDLDAYREQSLETWGKMAPGWEERNEWMTGVTGRVNEWIVEKADPQPGQTVLDLAAGPGDLGFQASARVGAGGRVLSTDFSPEMVEVARRLGAARGLDNVEHRVLDAERMDLDDDSVDAVVCRWGYMLMADPAAALAETRRVLRDGGPLAFAVWAAPERNPWAAMPAMTLVQRGHLPPPEPGAPGIFALADPELIRSLVAGAGFGEPELEEVEFDFLYDDFDDFWDVLIRVAGPLARAIEALPEDERQATREAIEQSIAPFRNEDGSYATPAVCWGALAR